MKTLPQPEITPHIEQRFWALVDKNGPVPAHRPDLGPCWQWTGHKWSRGYGCFKIKIGGKWQRYKAHRIAYLIAHGEFPSKGLGCHHCDNTSCCNAAHMFNGTNADNMTDKTIKGRASRVGPRNPVRGSRSPHAKLTEAQVLDIRRRYRRESHKVSNARALAAEFGIAKHHVLHLVAGIGWRHVSEEDAA